MVNFWQVLPRPFLALAPMEDVTDHVFREIIYGISRPDVCFTEFTSVEGLASKGREAVIHRLKYGKAQRPIVAQLWGYTPEAMRQAAATVQELGFDGVDINMGCPDKAVMKKGAGAGLIQTPSLAIELIHAAKEGAPNLPISVKTRVASTQELTVEWFLALLRQDIAALTIHFRTAAQMSKVSAKWEKTEWALQVRDSVAPDTLIVGNGDVQDWSQAKKMHKQYGVDGVMIGRGIFASPWAFEKQDFPEKHTKEESVNLLIKHVRLYDKTWKNVKNFHIMKRFFKIYVHSFDGASKLRARLMDTNNAEEALNTIRMFIQ